LLGPSLQEIAGSEPFFTWDNSSNLRIEGKTLDYIFLRDPDHWCANANQRVAFTNDNVDRRCSDHFGIEGRLELSPRPILGVPVVTAPLDGIEGGRDTGLSAFAAER